MSIKPTFSLTLIKDFAFKKKFNLTNTQVDVMAYLINLSSWAYSDGFGYYLALTSKIMDDLGLGLKTVEASLLQLKKLNLITTKLISPNEWDTFTKHRHVAITAKGRTYKSSFLPPKEVKKIDDLESQNKELREEMKKMEQEALEAKKRYLEEAKNSETSTPKVKPKRNEFQTIEKMKLDITKQFKRTKKPICNNAECGWLPETQIFINAYGSLAVLTPNKQFKQLDDLNMSNKFWEWLFVNQDRIGDIQKDPDMPNVSPLLKYIGEKFKLQDGTLCTIKDVVPKKGGVSLYLIHPRNGLLKIASNRADRLYTMKEITKLLEDRSILI